MRAWHCHGRTQKELVDRLTQAGIVTSPQVRAVLQQVDRQYYIPNNPYQDAPQTLGHGQTISAPHMHAHALQEMVPHLLQQCQSQTSSVLKILDVGCGSGCLTACLGRWFQTRPKQTDHNTHESIIPCKGRVFGIDIVPSLVQLSKNNILKHDKDLIDTGTVTLQLSNGWDGLPEEAPFAAIHVGAAAPSFPHQLAQQLAIGGVMIVPIGPTGGVQTLVKVIRTGNQGTATTSFVQSDFQISELLGTNGRHVPTMDASSLVFCLWRISHARFLFSILIAVRYVPLVEGP